MEKSGSPHNSTNMPWKAQLDIKQSSVIFWLLAAIQGLFILLDVSDGSNRSDKAKHSYVSIFPGSGSALVDTYPSLPPLPPLPPRSINRPLARRHLFRIKWPGEPRNVEDGLSRLVNLDSVAHSLTLPIERFIVSLTSYTSVSSAYNCTRIFSEVPRKVGSSNAWSRYSYSEYRST